MLQPSDLYQGLENDASAAKLKGPKVEISGLKMDVKSARAAPKIEFQVESVEKDMSAGVEVCIEERAQ